MISDSASNPTTNVTSTTYSRGRSSLKTCSRATWFSRRDSSKTATRNRWSTTWYTSKSNLALASRASVPAGSKVPSASSTPSSLNPSRNASRSTSTSQSMRGSMALTYPIANNTVGSQIAHHSVWVIIHFAYMSIRHVHRLLQRIKGVCKLPMIVGMGLNSVLIKKVVDRKWLSTFTLKIRMIRIV